MTMDDTLQPVFKELSCEDTQKQQNQQKPLHIVLVDIKIAAREKRIHCVEKPLTDKDLNYVALSYRWGELHEAIVDTKLGYLASVTSFALKDFYRLCDMMTREIDLQQIHYVWVDAICVHPNAAKRIAMVYQMSTIYDRARYILAVPDLHLQTLKNKSTKHKEIIEGSQSFSKFIYYLIQGNTDQLAQLDEAFLDDINVPNDPALRQLLKKYITKDLKHYINNDDEELLHHIYEINQASQAKDILQNTNDGLRHCNRVDCPLKLKDEPTTEWECRRYFSSGPWYKELTEKNVRILDSMAFLMDLVEDWSSRVLIIGEYTIAKQNNNLKYWFIQLDLGNKDLQLPFFKFDFTDPGALTVLENAHEDPLKANPMHVEFYECMIKHLQPRNFLEQILKSKTGKNEDRFYGILPISEYKETVPITDVASWGITTLASVKSKMYEWMTVRDKLNLLFLSGNKDALHLGQAFPTFATSTIHWHASAPADCFVMPHGVPLSSINFDLTHPATITFHKDTTENGHDDMALDYLQVTPMTCYAVKGSSSPSMSRDNDILLRKLLQVDDQNTNLAVDFVCIPSFGPETNKKEYPGIDWNDYYIALAGSFAKNKWILTSPEDLYLSGKRIDVNQKMNFNIY
ncbi:hypothetical protein BCR42DRAFT_428336 [Absidia repens]|uniref:Heterokaryon incompatibility domain-containing protein n=1 Tax=Absidia repens TaxID=90262 RepID=A0A1X2I050_9FUNG|nr:hypothetical protein BCR42DRAFT_428336 [Absidia repens]